MRSLTYIEESLIVSYALGHRLFREILSYTGYYNAAISYSCPATVFPDKSVLDVMLLTGLVHTFTDKVNTSVLVLKP
jgi:hypothetical protein